MKRKGRAIALLVATFVIASLFAKLSLEGNTAPYLTATVDRGDVVDVVGATGTLEPVTMVQVGSQVSGTIASLHADFNTVVTQNQVIARLDPSLFEARLGQARANVVATRAAVDRQRAAAQDAASKLARAEELSRQELLPASDLETARTTAQSAAAQLKEAEAAVSQATANVAQADVDLAHTVITAPIDGVVIARSVDVGQTVAASLQAPVLFEIANDLAHMQVKAAIDEADVGRVRTGQDVTFRVDAYPDREFAGQVQQVRLQPVTDQNVVTYNTIIAVDNAGQLLMPGMTATVSVVVRRSEDVLRLPVAALRFRPDAPAADAGPAAQRAATRRGAGQGMSEGQPRSGHEATVYVPAPRGQAQPRQVRLGLSDGRYVEVQAGLDEGATVIVGLQAATLSPTAATASPAASSNPFAPQFQRRQRQ